jgi:hypothetical protein
MGSLFSLLGAAASGGATGLLGIALQSVFGFATQWLKLKEQKQQNEHELAMKAADLNIMKEEWAGRASVAKTEGETAKDVAASTAFASTLLKEPEKFGFVPVEPKGWLATLVYWLGWSLLTAVDFIRGSVRPALTVYLCYITTSVWFEARHLASLEDLEPAQVLQLLTVVIETILYLTTTCVTWWFGTRNMQQPPTAAALELKPSGKQP